MGRSVGGRGYCGCTVLQCALSVVVLALVERRGCKCEVKGELGWWMEGWRDVGMEGWRGGSTSSKLRRDARGRRCCGLRRQGEGVSQASRLSPTSQPVSIGWRLACGSWGFWAEASESAWAWNPFLFGFGIVKAWCKDAWKLEPELALELGGKARGGSLSRVAQSETELARSAVIRSYSADRVGRKSTLVLGDNLRTGTAASRKPETRPSSSGCDSQ